MAAPLVADGFLTLLEEGLCVAGAAPKMVEEIQADRAFQGKVLEVHESFIDYIKRD